MGNWGGVGNQHEKEVWHLVTRVSQLFLAPTAYLIDTMDRSDIHLGYLRSIAPTKQD